MEAMRNWVVAEQDVLASNHEQFARQRLIIEGDERLLSLEQALAFITGGVAAMGEAGETAL